jgi:hypothetical protein
MEAIKAVRPVRGESSHIRKEPGASSRDSRLTYIAVDGDPLKDIEVLRTPVWYRERWACEREKRRGEALPTSRQ